YASDPNEPLKFSTKYFVKATRDLTNDAGDKAIREGCTPTATEDCTDFRTFTTGPFGILIDVQDKATGKLRIRFGHADVTRDPDRINVYTYEADQATLAALLPVGGAKDKAVKLFEQDPNTGNLTQVAASCVIPSSDAQS